MALKGKYKLLLFTFSLLAVSLACGTQTTLPTQTINTKVPTVAVKAVVKTPPPTATEIEVWTLGQVNLRDCPSTSCTVLKVIPAYAVVQAGAIIENKVVDCNRWRPVIYDGVSGFVCAGWLSK